jgi:hypothetical protein
MPRSEGSKNQSTLVRERTALLASEAVAGAVAGKGKTPTKARLGFAPKDLILRGHAAAWVDAHALGLAAIKATEEAEKLPQGRRRTR